MPWIIERVGVIEYYIDRNALSENDCQHQPQIFKISKINDIYFSIKIRLPIRAHVFQGWYMQIDKFEICRYKVWERESFCWNMNISITINVRPAAKHIRQGRRIRSHVCNFSKLIFKNLCNLCNFCYFIYFIY